jgi:hypothetical protein
MMDQSKKSGKKMPLSPQAPSQMTRHPEPLWAKGLEEIYASVVNEPLPDSFTALLDKLEDSAFLRKNDDDGK